MSGLSDTVKGATNDVTDKASNVGQSAQRQGSEATDNVPRSIPDTSADQSEFGAGHNGSGDGEGEMVPAAGRINDKGEVVDDEGNHIGRVTSGNAKDFANFVVTQEGDILNEDGGVVGKAEPLEDVASELNYTTKSTTKEDDASGGGLGSVVSGVGKAGKDTTDAVGDVAKDTTDTVGKATGTKDATDDLGDTAKGATDAAGKTAEGATDTAGDAAKEATDTAEGAAADAADGADLADGEKKPTDAVDEVGDKVNETAEDAKDTAESAAGQVQETAEDAADADAPSELKDAEDAADADAPSELKGAEDAADADAPSELKDAEEAPAKVGSQVKDLSDEVPAPTTIGDIKVPSLAPSVANKVVGLFEGPFTVSDGGKVADKDGKVVGKLAEGQDIQDLVGKEIYGIDSEGNLLGENETILGKVDIAPEGTSVVERVKEEVPEAADRLEALDKVQEKAAAADQDIDIQIPSFAPSVADKVIKMFDGPFNIGEDGQVKDANGKILGKLAEGQDFENLVGKDIKAIDGEGNLLGDNESVLGKITIVPEGTIVERIKDEVPEAADRLEALDKAQEQAAAAAEQQGVDIKIPSFAPSVAEKVIKMFEGPFNIGEDGQVKDANGKILGKLAEGQDFENLVGKDIKAIDGEGNLLGDNDTVLGKVTIVPEGTIVERIKDEVPEAAERLDALEQAKSNLPSLSILEGLKINKGGNVVDANGNPVGKVASGDLTKLAGRSVGKDGKVWDDSGNVIGEVEVLPETVKNESAPFEDFPDATIDKNGKVMFEGRQVGVVVGDDFQKFIGKKVDADGDILDKNGNVIGKAERAEAEEEPEPEQIDYSVLRDKKVNKAGNVVDDKGQVWGRVVQGILQNLIGKKVGDNGEIFNDAGKVIGKAEPVPDSEREDAREPAPFEDFPGATVGDEGKVMFNGEQVGIVVDGDAKKLKGKAVDADGDILDRTGNQLGRAERWEAPEAEPEPEVDNSPLAGKRINKAGNAVDKHGDIYGRVIEGALPRLIGKMCDKQGFIRNEGGDVIGKCELIPEAEREGMKEGPFSELPNCTVNKEGEIVTPGGDVVGRLVQGDAKVLFGRAVDDDGDILDKNGNVLGKAERWEKAETPKDVNPMSGRKVNREGNVVDENGDVVGRLTSGDLEKCAGKKIDDDGDVIDQKGSILGHVTLLEDIPPEKPQDEETEEDKQARLQLEQDRKIAARIADCLTHSLDRIKPILKMITSKIEAEEAKPEDERDEEALVKEVRPLIEEGGKILTEANGIIRGLDPDGRIAANAQHKTAAREATPEEYRLADLLKELTGHVTETIENAKKKLEGMPHAKKQINPLWGLLSEPLFQIIAAVGLLLSGVLGLVGKLLNGLGLGGLVNNLLGGLGLTKVLGALGLGDIVDTVTGQDQKKGGGKKKGGLLGLF